MTTMARRDLSTRDAGWAQGLAAALARAGVQPNAVSAAGLIIAFASAFAFAMSANVDGGLRSAWLLAAAAAIQLRLLCNLLDGMLAVEHRLMTPLGALYNEIPDRLADVAILVGAGYAVRPLPGGAVLGWLAAVLALMTASVRLLGGSLGLAQRFSGPMAKQHRMFVVTLGAAGAAAGTRSGGAPTLLYTALAIVVIGTAITVVRRIVHIAGELEER